MQITHVKSNIVPDFTGTVTVYDNSGSTQTVAATNLVRPSDWNSAHALAITLTGNTAGESTVSGTNIIWQGGPNITLSGSAGTVLISGGAGGGGGVAVSAGAASVSNGTVVFSNSHNVSFGLNGSTVTASASYSQSTAPGAIAAGTQTATSGTMVFSNSNGITFGMSGSTRITASHDGLTSQSNQAFSAAGGSSAFQTLSFLNANGLSFSNNGGGVQASYTVPTQTVQTQSLIAALYDGANSISTGTVRLSNLNGISFGINGQTLTGSHNGLTSQSNQNVTAGNGGFAFQTLSFSNANGISFGTSAGSAITASHNAITSQSNQQISGYAVSNTTQSSSGTLNAANLSFAGAGIASVGVSNGSVVISVPSGGGAGDGVVSLGMSTEGNTAGTTGTVSSGRMIFVGSGPISLSQSMNGQSGTLSILGPATSSLSATGQVSISTNGSTISIGVPAKYTKSGINPYADMVKVVGAVGQGTLQFDPQFMPDVQFDRIALGVYNTNSSNSSGSHTVSFWVGLYTRNASTLSLLGSTSTSLALTHSGTAGSYSLYSGIRLVTIASTATLTQGDYWIGVASRTTSGGANGSYSQVQVSNVNSNFLGHWSSSHNTTYQLTLGQGVYSATTSGMPASVGFTQIRGSDSMALRAPLVMFVSGTV